MPLILFKRTVGLPWTEVRALLLSHFDEAFPVDDFQAAWVRHFWVIAETRLALKPGALELLDTLDQFRLPRAIATSSSRRTVERHLTAQNLMERFQEIVGHGDYERGKPAPDPFLKAAERLGMVPRRCLALEDSHNGIRSASAAGMMPIMVPDLLEPTDEILRQRPAQVGPARLDLGEARALHHGLQAAADGLDLWQLGHAA